MAQMTRAARHPDWAAITTGTARYAADIHLPGELVAAVLRSPHPHARILHIDTSRARALPGVRAVLTGRDVTNRRYIDYRAVDADRTILAKDVVRHIGDPVALIAAEDEQTARRAVAAIRVRYRVMPAATTVAAALRPGAPRIHTDHPEGNVAYSVHRAFGDRAAAVADTRHEVGARYRSTRQSHVTMEPHTVIADWREQQGCLHVWAPSQAPRKLQGDLAQLFELEPRAVRMHELAVGGDFGGRTQISSTEAMVCALSMAAGRPVRLTQTRSEEFAFTKWRLSWDLGLRLGCDRDGRVTYLDADFDVDNGAYNQAGPGEMVYGSVALGSGYRWRSYVGDGRCIYTNKQSASSFRGAGGYAVNWALECGIDELADRAGIDPIDFRLRNAVSDPGERSLTGWQVKSGALRECLETVRREIDWDRKRADGGNGRGVGVACVMHVTALAREYMVRSSSAVDIAPSGAITIRSGCGDAGTGQKAIIREAVADVLGVDPEHIAITTTDTGRTPHDAGAGASRGSFHSVSAARKAAEAARDGLVRAAAEKFHVGPDDVRWAAGQARHGDDVLGIGELAALAAPQDEVFTTEAEFVGEFHDPAEDGFEDIAPTYSFAAHAVEVQVDSDTGQVRVVRVVAAHDSGTILNEVTARGQVEGGTVMGMGAVLGESLLFDNGRVVNPSYVDYVLPRSAEVPPIRTVFVGDPDPVGPQGAKGLGEIPLLTIGPAITNAISHAIGVRLTEAPHTPDQVLMAIRRRDRRSERAGSIGWNPRRWWVETMRRVYPYGLKKSLTAIAARLPASPGARAIGSVTSPASVDEAMASLAGPGRPAPLGGGTDILALQAQGLPNPAHLVDMTNVPGLRRVTVEADGALLLGAATTLVELAADGLVPGSLRETAELIATPQIRQVATIAGNLCQVKRCWFYRNGFDCYKRGGAARPCYAVLGDHRFYHAVEDGHRCQAVTPADLATTLLALDAEVETRSLGGGRRLTIAELYSGPGEVTLRPGEAITAIRIPARARERTTLYRKAALWQGAFAVFTIAVSATPDHGRVRDLRVVLGGVAPTPRRESRIERALTDAPITDLAIRRAVDGWLRRTHPLPDNHWKAFAAANKLRETLRELLLGAGG